MAAYSVPIGTVSYGALSNLAKSTYGQDWNTSVFKNVVTYETSEPGVATKVALGEVDAGFVYESTAAAGKDTYATINIPKKDNVLQTYQIGVMKQSTSKGRQRISRTSCSRVRASRSSRITVSGRSPKSPIFLQFRN